MSQLSPAARTRLFAGALLCLMGALFGLIVFWADTGTMPAFIMRLYAFPYGDKAGHFLLMGLISAVANIALAGRRLHVGRFHPLAGSVLVVTIVSAEELSQRWFSGRTFSPVDLGFSLLGIWSAGILAEKLRNSFHRFTRK
ncbi:MAG: hypothetical protein H6642_08395 [Caldilineaceae bacterium]|nr:hypothetical protein [Caldilineaceae bacterium]